MKLINQTATEFIIILCVFLAAFLLSIHTFGQEEVAQEIEFGLLGGSSHYKGDLTQGTLIQSPSTQTASGIFIRYNGGTRLNWKFNFVYGQIAGADQYSHTESQRLRNLHFKSSVLEYSIQGEYKFLNRINAKENENPFLNKKNNLSAYGFIGLGVCFINPKAQYNGTWYELQPLGTEGQGIMHEQTKTVTATHYSLVQLVMPIGIGVSYSLSDRIKIGFEIGYRKTFTDYLDDVSGNYADPKAIEKSAGPVAAALSNRSGESANTPSDISLYTTGQKRGNAATKDSYVFSVIHIGWLIKN